MALSAHSDMKLTTEEPAPDGDGDSARAGSGKTLKVLGGLVLVTLVVGGIWIGFGDRIMAMLSGTEGDVPVIAADPSPIKVRPESPGGMQVPNQGRLVYGVVDGTASQPRVERLLPSPDKPMEVDQVLKRSVPEASAVIAGTAPRGTADASAPRPLIPASPPTTQSDSQSNSLSAVPSAADVSSLQPPPPAPAPVKNAEAQSSTSAPPAAVKTPPAAPAPAAQAKAAAPPTVPSSTQTARATPAPAAPVTDLDKAFRIQLAAARNEEAVEAEWNNLRRRHVDLLGDLQLQVMKIDLGATKGVFYRLRAGPLADEPTAKALCERLKQRKLGCLVVKPGT
ncbi:MAG: SPOR domain-containing protein [Rhodospirillales bacterium]